MVPQNILHRTKFCLSHSTSTLWCHPLLSDFLFANPFNEVVDLNASGQVAYTHTSKWFGMKNDKAFFQYSSEFALAKVGFTSKAGSVTPKAS